MPSSLDYLRGEVEFKTIIRKESDRRIMDVQKLVDSAKK